MIIYHALILLLVLAAAFDVARLRIPNPVCAAVAALFLIPGIIHAPDLDLAGRFAALAAVLLVGWPLFTFGLVGGGDVKLLAATSLWVGLDRLLLHVACIALLGLVLLVVLLAVRYVAQGVAARLRIAQGGAFPLSLVPGEGVPYGVAIAGSTLILMGDMPGSLWAF